MEQTLTENQVDFELSTLRKHFKVVQKEKFASATLNFFYDQARKKEHNGKLGQKAKNRIIQHIRTEFRKRYGAYADVWFNKKGQVGYNIDQIYKTDMGTLYSSYAECLKYILVTTHAIERFEERFGNYLPLINILPKMITNPTALSMLFALLSRPKAYYIENNFYHLLCMTESFESIITSNSQCYGSFVLEKIDSLFIVKTFLPLESCLKTKKWMLLDISEFKTLQERLLNLKLVNDNPYYLDITSKLVQLT